MITVELEVLKRSFEYLQRCGGGEQECVVVWTGPQARAGYIDGVVHPRHTASGAHYDIDPAWIGEFWFGLAAEERTARAQVHTHPHHAYHSHRDDVLALVHTPGYMSLVIPNFASGPVSLAGAYLTVRREKGGWKAVDPAISIEVGR